MSDDPRHTSRHRRPVQVETLESRAPERGQGGRTAARRIDRNGLPIISNVATPGPMPIHLSPASSRRTKP